MNKATRYIYEQISGKDYPITNQISAGRNTRATWIPTYKTPKTFWLCNQVLGIQGKHNISPKLAIPTSSCIHPSTHNQETFGNHVPQPSKSIRYTSYGNSTELLPQYWVVPRLSHQQPHKRDFWCLRTQVFQNCNDKIVTTTPRSSTPQDTATTPKCQEAPRTMFSSQDYRNDSKIPAWS